MSRRAGYFPGGVAQLVGDEGQELRFALGEGGE